MPIIDDRSAVQATVMDALCEGHSVPLLGVGCFHELHCLFRLEVLVTLEAVRERISPLVVPCVSASSRSYLLRRAVAAFLEHYHAERNHQGLDNELIEPGEDVGGESGDIDCRERLGSLLKYYHRAA